MANILNCRAVFHRFGSSRKQKQQPLEAETLNFRALMDSPNQQNLKKLKEAISLSVHKRNILVIIDKIDKTFFQSFGYTGLVFIIVFVITLIDSIYQSCISS